MHALSVPSVRWGIIGTANIARAAVIPAIHASRNGEVVTVASRDAERARAFAAANGIPRSAGTYQSVLDDPGVDAVYIPLPNSLHREWTLRAADAGKHVLCEKPLGLTERECQEMGAAAERAGVHLMEAFMYRFHPRTEHAITIAREEAVGPLRIIRSSFSFKLRNRDNIRLQRDLGGGSLMDVGCYCVNASRTLAGREPVEVFAFTESGPAGVDESMAGQLRFQDGLTAQFDCSLVLERREEYQVVGTGGDFVVPRAFLPGTGDVTIQVHRGGNDEVEQPFAGIDQYQLMVEHFGACVTEGTPVRYPAAEAAANMRVIEALYRSAASGAPEAV